MTKNVLFIENSRQKHYPNSFLLAESGATKTEWRLCAGGALLQAFRSVGFNPNVMSPALITEELSQAIKAHMEGETVDAVYFYGAGINGDLQFQIMQDALNEVFPESNVFIAHDILAAVRSMGRSEGILCMLGTGSNSCYYKDGQIEKVYGGIGYIFGDEGSGMDLGKHLVKGLLEERFPDEVKSFIEKQEGSSINDLKTVIYTAAKPNVRLANLARYLEAMIKFPEIEAMILSRFIAYLESTVVRYDNYQTIDTDFIGSISFFFKPILEQACRQKGVRLGRIIKDPIEYLITYHLERHTMNQ